MDNKPDHAEHGDIQQQAVARRLARLATMPVETRRLDETLRRQISRRPRLWLWWATPLTALAASLVIMIALFSSTTPRLSAADMAGVYWRLTSAKQPMVGAMHMKMMCQLMPGEHGMCCRQMVEHQSLTCMCIHTRSGPPVVMVMGNVHHVEMPALGKQSIMFAGHTYTLTHSGTLNMVMRCVNGKWFCVMGRRKPATLAAYMERTARGN
ncbi:MAG: hypothetical protein M1472_03375 [Planctomycetes bacterium]|jgi:hypothetical protein|nr:hypothetical protein [Planctomycetota bacterium]MDA8376613.1 hypothetical protein [Planctomycetia bacterium]